MSRWLRDPLLHFLAIGALLFAVYSRLGGGERPAGEVVLGSAEIEALAAGWERQWRRPPTTPELERLVEEEVRRELLYREALRLGLDRDDDVVRRRLIEKMEFIGAELAGSAAPAEPAEAELERFFEANRDRYREAARVSFSHVFFDPALRGAAAEADARRALADLLGEAEPPPRAPELGDPFPLQTDYPDKTREQIARHFGAPFADAVLALPEQGWAGPLESTYGVHLVYRGERREGRRLELAEVRDRLAADWAEEGRRLASERLIAELRERYPVVVDRAAIEAHSETPVAADGGER